MSQRQDPRWNYKYKEELKPNSFSLTGTKNLASLLYDPSIFFAENMLSTY